MTRTHEANREAAVPAELQGHEPVPARRSSVRPLAYGALTAMITLAFLLQILNGVCPVP